MAVTDYAILLKRIYMQNRDVACDRDATSKVNFIQSSDNDNDTENCFRCMREE
jgi:hypothetical protein